MTHLCRISKLWEIVLSDGNNEVYSCQANTVNFMSRIIDTATNLQNTSKTVKTCIVKPEEDISTSQLPYFEDCGLTTPKFWEKYVQKNMESRVLNELSMVTLQLVSKP